MKREAELKKLTYTVHETASLLGLSRSATYQAIANGSIPSLRIGGRILVPAVQLERLLGGEQLEPPRE